MRGNLTEQKIEMAEAPVENTVVDESRSDRVRQERVMQKRERRPMGQHGPLEFPGIPGYHLHVINDTGMNNRVQEALEAGYTPVVDTAKVPADGDVGRGSQMGNAVSRPVGKGVTGILMKIPQEWHDEDYAKKQAKDDAITKGIIDYRRVGAPDAERGAIAPIPGTPGISIERY